MFFFKNKSKSNEKIADDLLKLHDDLRKEKGIGFLYVEYGNMSRVLSALDFKKVVSTSQGILYSNAYGLAAVVKDSLYISYAAPIHEDMYRTGILSFFNRDSEPTHIYGFKTEVINHYFHRIDDFSLLQTSFREKGALIPRDAWIPKMGWDLSQILWNIAEEAIKNNKKFKDPSVLDFFTKAISCDFNKSEKNHKTLTRVIENVYWNQFQEKQHLFPPSEEMQRNLKSLCDFMINSPQNTWREYEEFIKGAFDFHPLVPLLHLSVLADFKKFPFEHQNSVVKAIEDIIEFTSKEELKEIWALPSCGPSLSYSIFKDEMEYSELSKILDKINKKLMLNTNLLSYDKNNGMQYFLCHDSNFCSDLINVVAFLEQNKFFPSSKAGQLLIDIADFIQSYQDSSATTSKEKQKYEDDLRKYANEILIDQNLKISNRPILSGRF